MSQTTAPSPRTTVKRLPIRASYDREAIRSILDEALICHLGFASGGQPYVIPTIHARRDDHLLIHGSQASRMLRTVRTGVDVCVTVTLLDGLVLARSAFHHSMNYRSVVILGRATQVTSDAEKNAALEAFTNHVVPGRWDDVRQPTEQELKATTVLALPLEEVSAKVRTGGPVDDEPYYALPVWAGVLPLEVAVKEPIPDAQRRNDPPVPEYMKNYARPK